MPRNPAGVYKSMLLTLALVIGSPAFGQASDRIEGPVPEEVAAFKDAAARFNARADEMRSDTKAFVDFREREEKAKLRESYDVVLEDLAEKERNQRDVVIQRMNEFLAKYPDAEDGSHVRFRLADLYFEVESEDWLERSRIYFEKLNDDNLSLEEAERLETEGEPKLDLSRSVALYKRIIEDNASLPKDQQYDRLDGVYLMLGFVYSEENAALPEPDYPTGDDVEFDPTDWEAVLSRKGELAKATFRGLIENVPESDLADRAHLFLGNFLFDEGDFDGAVAEYQFVYDKGVDGQYFDESVYQLAWSYYKVDNLEEAVPRFTEVLDRAETIKTDTGKDSPFRADAIKYMAFSFSDQGQGDYDSLAKAREYFQSVGDREYEWDVYVAMTDSLTRYGRFDEAVEIYEFLQTDPRYVNRPENPDFQMQVVRINASPKMIDDLEASGAARLELTSKYNEGTTWWEANRNNPEALATARGYIEASLGSVATELRVRADESGDQAAYVVAAEKYREYLDNFPIADDYYEKQWYLADTLRLAGQVDEALVEYEELIKSGKYHPYGDGSLFIRMTLLNAQLAEVAPPGERPADAVVERTYTSEAGEEIEVYALGPLQTRFIEACDAVLENEFKEPPADVQDFRGTVDEFRHALAYIPAQILFYHNRFDEARPRLEEVIDKYPRKDEASFAAGLLVDSYTTEGDLAAVRKLTNRFTTMVLGTADVPDPEGKFRSLLEGTAFKQAQALAESEDSLAAADAFIAFLEDFPNSQHKEFSLYNAAFYYQQGGKAEKANELYEEFLQKYPDHEWSEKLYFRIATLYESTLQLEKAVDYYTDLARRFPDGDEAPDAIFNSAYLQVGLGRNREAARGLERYGNDFPDRPDAEKVFFQAGEQWEAVSQREGIAFYDRYLKKFGNDNPDNALTAMARRAEIYKAQNNDRAYDRELDRIETTFDEITAAGGELGPNAHKYAAMAGFRSLKSEFDAFVTGELTKNEDRDTALLDEKKAALKEFEPKAKAFAGKYDNFEYSSEALLMLGQAPLYLSRLGLGLECPNGYSEDDCYLFYDILEEKVFPQFRKIEEEIAVPRLNELVSKARELKRHSRAVEEAQAELNRVNPVDYPAVKNELFGETDSTAPTSVRGVRAPKKVVEEE